MMGFTLSFDFESEENGHHLQLIVIKGGIALKSFKRGKRERERKSDPWVDRNIPKRARFTADANCI